MALFNILVDIAANTAKLEAGINRANSQIDGFASKVKRVGELAAIGGLTEFIKRIIDTGAELEHASVRAGTSGKVFSELAYAAKQSGVGTDQLATAMSKMNKAMSEAATGAKEPNDALKALGLSFDDLKKLSPDQQLEVIADRFSRLPSPADKARVAIDLFGRAGAELEPLLEKGADGIIQLRSEAERLGASFSDDLLKKLEESHQSITRLTTSFGAMATTIVGNVAPSLTAFTDSITAIATGDKVQALRAQIEYLRQLSHESFGPLNLNPFAGLIGDRAGRRANDLEQQLQQLQALADFDKRIREYSPDMNNLLGGSAPGFTKGPPKLEEIVLGKKSDRVLTDKVKALYDEWNKQTETAIEGQVAEFTHFNDLIDELIKDGIITAAEGSKRISEELDKILPGVDVTLKKQKAPVKQEFDEMEALGESAARNIQGAFANFLFNPFHGGLKRMAVDFLQILQRMAAEAAAAQIFKSLFGSGDGTKSGGGSGLGSILGSVLSSFAASGGARAGGGSVSPGSAYLVGEDGPELFTAASHGTITPNSALGGGGDVHMNYNIDARGADEAASARLAATLPAVLAAHGARMKADMLNAFRRNGLSAPARA